MMRSHQIRQMSNAFAAGTVSPRAPAALRELFTRLWPIFVTMWLVFVITGPVALLLDAPLTPRRMLVALAWTVAFFSAYLWLMLHKPFRHAELTAEDRRVQIGLLALLTGLVLSIDLAYSVGWFWLFIYVVMPAGFVLPTRAAIVTIVAITILAGAIDGVRAGWDAAGSVLGIALWGFSMIILRRLVIVVDELRAAREELARLAVAEERLRFARDLHDLLGHSLSLIALKSELARRLLPTDHARATAEIADVERVARQSLREVREAVAGYRQPSLANELSNVRALLDAAGIETGIMAEPGALPPAVDAVLGWTVREGGTNVIRHSRARHCQIRVSRENGTVRAEVIDDGLGQGATPPETAGSGLSGLAERVAAGNGQMATGSGENGGFRLQVILPLADVGATPDGSGARGAKGVAHR